MVNINTNIVENSMSKKVMKKSNSILGKVMSQYSLSKVLVQCVGGGK